MCRNKGNHSVKFVVLQNKEGAVMPSGSLSSTSSFGGSMGTWLPAAGKNKLYTHVYYAHDMCLCSKCTVPWVRHHPDALVCYG